MTVDDKVWLAMTRYSVARTIKDGPRAATLARAAYAELAALKDDRADDIATWAAQRRIKL